MAVSPTAANPFPCHIAITGANSSVGIALLSHVADHQDDLHVRAAVRTREAEASLPRDQRITSHVIRYGDADTLASLLDGVSCLVHLAGILIESRRSSYQTANVDATRAVVEACRDAGVDHIVIISALGADSTSSNGYYRSKGMAEQLVTGSGTSVHHHPYAAAARSQALPEHGHSSARRRAHRCVCWVGDAIRCVHWTSTT